MDSLNNIIKSIDDFVWGIPLIVLIMACGIWLTIRCCGLQFRHLGKALKFMVKNEEGGDGEVSSFAALCTALSAQPFRQLSEQETLSALQLHLQLAGLERCSG